MTNVITAIDVNINGIISAASQGLDAFIEFSGIEDQFLETINNELYEMVVTDTVDPEVLEGISQGLEAWLQLNTIDVDDMLVLEDINADIFEALVDVRCALFDASLLQDAMQPMNLMSELQALADKFEGIIVDFDIDDETLLLIHSDLMDVAHDEMFFVDMVEAVSQGLDNHLEFGYKGVAQARLQQVNNELYELLVVACERHEKLPVKFS